MIVTKLSGLIHMELNNSLWTERRVHSLAVIHEKVANKLLRVFIN